MQCNFCPIITGQAPAVFVRRWPNVAAFVPLNPVTPGHVLVIPHEHVTDAGVDPELAGKTFKAAAQLAAALPDFNILTSKGEAATQTVFHLHFHVVPRSFGDGLPLPWTPQHEGMRR